MTLRAVTLQPEPLCVSPDTSLLDALHLMLDRGVNHLPVCDGGVWAGLVDINDILYELLPVSARGEHGLKDLRFVGDGDRPDRQPPQGSGKQAGARGGTARFADPG